MFKNKIRIFAEKISGYLSYISMTCIFIVALMMFVDVIIRLVTKKAIVGTYEITEMGMVVVIFFALAFTQTKKGHVHVTMFIEKLPDTAHEIIDGLTMTFSVIVSICVTAAAFIQANTYFNGKATTSVLKIPYFPFAYVLAIGMTLFTFVMLIDAIEAFAKIGKKESKASPESLDA